MSLIVIAGGPVETTAAALELFVRATPYNFYPILLVLFTLGICLQLIPDFGPMKKAETRARETGLLLREGAVPLLSDSDFEPDDRPLSILHLVAGLFVPIAIVLGIAIGSFLIYDSVMIAEAFMTATLYLSVVLTATGRISGVRQLSDFAMKGILSVIPALLIVALAYALNSTTQTLGAADWIIEVSSGTLTPGGLVAMTFLLTSVISFSTGTSWGAYALMIPLALPLAYSFTGGSLDPLVYKTLAAVIGGGIFGDHASPLSDTSVLSSAGAGSDHMDHVTTQIPYALSVAVATFILYWLV